MGAPSNSDGVATARITLGEFNVLYNDEITLEREGHRAAVVVGYFLDNDECLGAGCQNIQIMPSSIAVECDINRPPAPRPGSNQGAHADYIRRGTQAYNWCDSLGDDKWVDIFDGTVQADGTVVLRSYCMAPYPYYKRSLGPDRVQFKYNVNNSTGPATVTLEIKNTGFTDDDENFGENNYDKACDILTDDEVTLDVVSATSGGSVSLNHIANDFCMADCRKDEIDDLPAGFTVVDNRDTNGNGSEQNSERYDFNDHSLDITLDNSVTVTDGQQFTIRYKTVQSHYSTPLEWLQVFDDDGNPVLDGNNDPTYSWQHTDGWATVTVTINITG